MVHALKSDGLGLQNLVFHNPPVGDMSRGVGVGASDSGKKYFFAEDRNPRDPGKMGGNQDKTCPIPRKSPSSGLELDSSTRILGES